MSSVMEARYNAQSETGWVGRMPLMPARVRTCLVDARESMTRDMIHVTNWVYSQHENQSPVIGDAFVCSSAECVMYGLLRTYKGWLDGD